MCGRNIGDEIKSIELRMPSSCLQISNLLWIFYPIEDNLAKTVKGMHPNKSYEKI